MQEIKCPKCGEVFQVDETGYAAIVKQVRDKEFSKEIQAQEQRLTAEKENAVQLAKAQTEKELRAEIADRDTKLAELSAKLSAEQSDKQHAVNEAVVNKENELRDTIADKDARIAELTAQLNAKETEKKLAVNEAVAQKDKEITQKEFELNSLKSENTAAIQGLKDNYEGQLRLKDEQIAQYKDFKARLSTKMVGESLERHCENEFNNLRALGFKEAYFDKDNDARTGSKGDYIYRDFVDGMEFISIMFEMKNEMDETATKHKNEDFLKELDKDRNEKNCEYAVLVSMLETDNDLYNAGIVDMSHRYPKMYVIRPQFFIPIITLLRNAALNSVEYKRELTAVRNQNVDITNFESKLVDFKDKFSKNYKHASDHFEKAINEIDKSIKALEKVKSELKSSVESLRLANNKAEDLTIKSLTYNNPTMKAKFAELKNGGETPPDTDD